MPGVRRLVASVAEGTASAQQAVDAVSELCLARAGDVILFESWLRHSVAASMCEEELYMYVCVWGFVGH